MLQYFHSSAVISVTCTIYRISGHSPSFRKLKGTAIVAETVK